MTTRKTFSRRWFTKPVAKARIFARQPVIQSIVTNAIASFAAALLLYGISKLAWNEGIPETYPIRRYLNEYSYLIPYGFAFLFLLRIPLTLRRLRMWIYLIFRAYILFSFFTLIVLPAFEPHHAQTIDLIYKQKNYLIALLITFIVWMIWKMPGRILEGRKLVLTNQEHITLENSLRTTILQVIGGFLVLIGFYFSWQSSNIANENFNLSLRQNDDERFEKNLSLFMDEKIEQREIGINNLTYQASTAPERELTIERLFLTYVNNWFKNAENRNLKDVRPPANKNKIPLPTDIRAIFDGLEVILVKRVEDYDTKEIPQAKLKPNYLSDLQGINFSGFDLDKINMSFTDMSESKFRDAHVRSAFLGVSFLVNADFYLCRCDKTYFGYSNLSNASFKNATLKSADFRGANMKGVDLSGATISGANFRDASNLTIEQVKNAIDYKSAEFSDDLTQLLGLPLSK